MSKKRDKGKLKTRKELKAEYDEYMDKQKKKREYYKRRRVEAERDAYIKELKAKRLKRAKEKLGE